MFFPLVFAFAVGNRRYTIPIRNGTIDDMTKRNNAVILFGIRRYRNNDEENETMNPRIIFVKTIEYDS